LHGLEARGERGARDRPFRPEAVPVKRLAAALMVLMVVVPAEAAGPIATTGEVTLHVWQAKRLVGWNAREGYRPDFRIESARRVDARTVRVCWSEPGYLAPEDGRDYGCDMVQLRGRQWWLRDGSLNTWRRRL
jgi:hypothetical protein